MGVESRETELVPEYKGQKWEYCCLAFRTPKVRIHSTEDLSDPTNYHVNTLFVPHDSPLYGKSKSNRTISPLGKKYQELFRERAEELGGFSEIETLQILGNDGWELVDVNNARINFFLKRPKQVKEEHASNP